MTTIASLDDRLAFLLSVLSVLLGGLGLYFLLPSTLPFRTRIATRVASAIGSLLAASSLLLFVVLFWSPPADDVIVNGFFYLFGLSALTCAVLMITSRDPIYSALWFAAVILSSAGLFLLAGAPFLAAGTVIVYAGAIIVTFLFVIMLAQQGGLAIYDRMARAPRRAVLSCSFLLWSLLVVFLYAAPEPVETPGTDTTASTESANETEIVVRSPLDPAFEVFRTDSQRLLPPAERDVRESAFGPNAMLPRIRLELREPDPGLSDEPVSEADSEPADNGGEADPGDSSAEDADSSGTETRESTLSQPEVGHVAGLGAMLYTEHLLSVEVVGVLLFIALVGAVAITTKLPDEQAQASSTDSPLTNGNPQIPDPETT